MTLGRDVKISVVVCTYNRVKYLEKSIESLANQSISKHNFEVLIVNNNSKDGTHELSAQLLMKYGDDIQLRYFIETEQGLSYARNKGIKESQYEYICFIDDDAIAEPDFLKNIQSFFENHPEASGIGGKIIPYYVDGKPNWMNHFMEGLVAKVDYGEKVFRYNGKKYPIGCNMTYLKKDLQAIGLFDVELGRKGNSGEASEEKDIFLKLQSKDRPVFYLPNARVEHVIEKPRLEYAYIKKISLGIGRSEHIRNKKLGWKKLYLKYFELLIKLSAGVALSLIYLFVGRWSASLAILRFRIDILKGWHNYT